MTGQELYDALMGHNADPFKWLSYQTQGRFDSWAARFFPEDAEEFWYLGGPMTGIPQFNFPRFITVAGILRKQGYKIVSPAELDDPETYNQAMASPDGCPGTGVVDERPYETFLGRDLAICSSPKCVGGIFLEGWQHSRGALAETWVLEYLGKEIFEYSDGPVLKHVGHRDDRLLELGVSIMGVPSARPGVTTAAARKEQ